MFLIAYIIRGKIKIINKMCIAPYNKTIMLGLAQLKCRKIQRKLCRKEKRKGKLMCQFKRELLNS